MFTQIRSSQLTGQAGNVVSTTVADFSTRCIAAGYSGFGMSLTPKEGKVPTIFWAKKDNAFDRVTVNISKPVAASLASGKLNQQQLLGLQIIDGTNAKGEPRYYLAHDGVELTDANQVTLAATKIREVMRAKANITDISKLMEI